jgi:hypothetical protein
VLTVRRALSLLVLLPCPMLGCGSDDRSGDDDAASGSLEPAGKPSAADLATAEVLGSGDGSPESVELTAVYDPSDHPSGYQLAPTALAWNTARPNELWVTLRDKPNDEPCNQGNPTGCPWLIGYAAIITDAEGSSASVEVKVDDNAWHFMRRPSSIAFGDAELFATCGEARTANYESESAAFNGPVLWTSDPAIFGASGAGTETNSTHIDMLHATPYCMGIAHERDNVYWTFNGDAGSLDRYDFHVPHAPGEDDHEDGEIWRYAAGQLARIEDTPSHLVYDASSGLLYAADTGHQRVVALHTDTGTPGIEFDALERLQTHLMMDGARLDVVIAPGRLGRPSGLTLHEGVLFVTDPPTRRVVAYDRAGHTLRELDTGLPNGALGAISISPGGKAFITDKATGRVLRIDPR